MLPRFLGEWFILFDVYWKILINTGSDSDDVNMLTMTVRFDSMMNLG